VEKNSINISQQNIDNTKHNIAEQKEMIHNRNKCNKHEVHKTIERKEYKIKHILYSLQTQTNSIPERKKETHK
jgi:hypothetical protein